MARRRILAGVVGVVVWYAVLPGTALAIALGLPLAILLGALGLASAAAWWIAFGGATSARWVDRVTAAFGAAVASVVSLYAVWSSLIALDAFVFAGQ